LIIAAAPRAERSPNVLANALDENPLEGSVNVFVCLHRVEGISE
jgi:hypothetical protein